MLSAQGLPAFKQIPAGSVIAIGNFDGLHRGHQRILQVGRELRDQTQSELVVVTFEPHPLTVLAPEKAPPRLTPQSIKHDLLINSGVDRLVTLPPDREVLDLSAETFWSILRDQIKPAHLVEGRTFTFGKGRGGNTQKLIEWSQNTPIQLHVIQPVEATLLDMSIVPVSSSLIRWLLAHGRVRDAGILMGRPYILEGIIIQGHQRGRTIGVPTANLDCASQMIPMEGVYSGRCMINDHHFPAAVSIGKMETFGQNQRPQIEAHLIGFTGDLYGQTLRLELLDWIREQRKFPGIESLKSQLALDIRQSSQKPNNYPATTPIP